MNKKIMAVVMAALMAMVLYTKKLVHSKNKIKKRTLLNVLYCFASCKPNSSRIYASSYSKKLAKSSISTNFLLLK